MTRQNSERLRKILLEYDQSIYPTVPDSCRAITIFPDTNERGIKKNIKQWCRASGFKYLDTDSKAKAHVKIETLRHASGVGRKKISVHYRKSEFEVGNPDIQISKNNRLFEIEIKAQNKRTGYKDRQSQVQKNYQEKSENVFGNSYYIVTGMDSFFELYDDVILKTFNK